MWSGWSALNLENSSALQLSAKEHEASMSGRSTLRVGLRILAVSAIK